MVICLIGLLQEFNLQMLMNAAEELGDMPTGPEFDVKDIYFTSDSTYMYVRIDINPAATFAGMYNNYTNSPAISIIL